MNNDDWRELPRLVREARQNGRAEGRAEGPTLRTAQVLMVFAAGSLAGVLSAYGPLRFVFEVCP